MRDDAGFTLVEMIVAITLLGIVMIPLAAAFRVGGITSKNAKERLEGTASTLFTSAYWADDVQSADTVTKDGSACDGTGSSVVTFSWAADPAVPTGPTSAVSYAVRTNTGGGRRLVRISCVGATPVVNTVVPRLGTGAPAVTCDVIDPALPPCALSPHAAGEPMKVTIRLTTAGTTTEPDGVEFSVSGARRSTS